MTIRTLDDLSAYTASIKWASLSWVEREKILAFITEATLRLGYEPRGILKDRGYVPW